MKPFRSTVKSLIRKLGYELTVYRPNYLGENPFSDIESLMDSYALPIVFDVGAHTGTTINAFRNMIPNAEIHAFEPGPLAFEALSTHYGSAKDVFLNNVGVGDLRETRTFFQNKSLVMSSFLPLGPDGWGKIGEEIPVDITTLDSYCEENQIPHISALKLDTQGYDLAVLRGSESLLATNRIQLILMEITFIEIYSGIPPFDEIFRFLTDRGFRLVSFYKFNYKDGVAGWTDAAFH